MKQIRVRAVNDFDEKTLLEMLEGGECSEFLEDRRNSQNMTPLLHACNIGNLFAANKLIDHGANLEFAFFFAFCNEYFLLKIRFSGQLKSVE